jgi:pyruvate kinase
LLGPEIRTGKLKENAEGKRQCKLVAGDEILVTTDMTILGDSSIISLDYKELCKSVKVYTTVSSRQKLILLIGWRKYFDC